MDKQDHSEQPGRRSRGRPRIHKDKAEAQRVASAKYRSRRRARRQAPTIHSAIIDLSAVAAYKVRK